MIYLIVDTMNDNYGLAIKEYIFLNEILFYIGIVSKLSSRDTNQILYILNCF